MIVVYFELMVFLQVFGHLFTLLAGKAVDDPGFIGVDTIDKLDNIFEPVFCLLSDDIEEIGSVERGLEVKTVPHS